MARGSRCKVKADGSCPDAADVFRLMLCAGSWRASLGVGSVPERCGVSALRHEVAACLCGRADGCGDEAAGAAVWIRAEEEALCARVFSGGRDGVVSACGQELSLMADGREVLRGRADAVFLDERGSRVVVCAYDWAAGRDADGCGDGWRLAALAVLLARELGYVPQVYAAVLRPFAVEREVAPVFFCPADVVAAREAILDVLARAVREDVPCDVSEAACRGCRARGVCRAFSRGVEEWSLADVERVWRELPPSRKLAAFRLARLAEGVAARIDACCEAELKAGDEIPGLALSPGRQLFSVADASEAFSLLSARFPRHVSAVSFARCCRVSVSDLERLVHAARREEDASASVKGSRVLLRDLLAPCSEVRFSRGSLRECGGAGAAPGCPF